MDEQKLNDLIHELQNLVKTLDKMPGSSSGSSIDTDKLVRAIGLLAAKLDTTARSRTAETRAADDFTKSVNNATAQAQKQAKSAADLAAANEKAATVEAERIRVSKLSSAEIKKEARERAQAGREEVINEARARKSITEGQASLAKSFSNVGISLGSSATTLSRTFQQVSIMGQGLGNTISAIGSFTLGMQTGAQGFTALNPVIDAAAAAFSGIPILGGLVKAAAEGTKMLINQLSQTVQAFESVGKVGGLTTEGMSGLQKQFQTSGMTIDSYTNTIVTNSATLARFAGTVGDGAETFSKTAGKVQKDFGLGLQNLGYGINEIGETTASYIALQTRLGRAQGKSVNELAAGSYKYALELDALAKLTGASKDELKKQQDAALSEARFRAKYDEMVANGQEVQAKAMLDFQSMVNTVSPEVAQGLRDVSTGFTNSQAAIKLFNTTNGRGMEIQARLQAGEIDQVQAFKELQGAVGSVLPQMGKFAQMAGDTDVYTAYAQSSDFVRAELDSLGNVIVKQRKQIEGADPLTASTRQAQRSMQEAMIELNKIGFELLPSAATVIESFTSIVKKSVEEISKDIVRSDPKSAAKLEAANYEAMTLTEKAQTRIAQGIEKLYEIAGATWLAEKARNQRIENQSNYLKKLVDEGTTRGKDPDVAAAVSAQSLPNTPKFSDGGIASGPASGHLAMLHGTEAVIPLKGGSIPMKILGSSRSSRDIDSGPVFNPQSETNFLLEKQNQELGKINVTLEEMLTYMLDGTISMTGTAPGVVGPSTEPSGPQTEAPEAPAGKYVLPTEGRVSSEMGYRNHPVSGKKQYHGGIDIAGKQGQAIYAPEGGTVQVKEEVDKSGRSKGYGKYIDIVNEAGIVIHRMAHLSDTLVKSGEKVKAGQEIAKMGGAKGTAGAGTSTGAHLHWEAKDPVTGKLIDPRTRTAELAAQQKIAKREGEIRMADTAKTENLKVAGAKEVQKTEVATVKQVQAAAPVATAAAPGATAAAASSGGLMNIVGGMLGLSGPTAQKASAGPGGLTDLISGAGSGIMGMLGLGTAPATPGQPTMAGVPAGGQPGAIGTDISAITQAMQAQTAATQSAITTGMQDLTTRLVDKIGTGGSGATAADPAVPTLLGDILSASREQTSAINRLIQVQTS